MGVIGLNYNQRNDGPVNLYPISGLYENAFHKCYLICFIDMRLIYLIDIVDNVIAATDLVFKYIGGRRVNNSTTGKRGDVSHSYSRHL